MTARALPRLGLAVALAVAPLACASGPGVAEVNAPGSGAPVRRPSNQQIKDRDRALVAGLATGLALGLVGLGDSRLCGADRWPASAGLRSSQHLLSRSPSG